MAQVVPLPPSLRRVPVQTLCRPLRPRLSKPAALPVSATPRKQQDATVSAVSRVLQAPAGSPVGTANAQPVRRSVRISTLPPVVYRPPSKRTQRRFYVYDVVDRETEEPFRYRVKWLGYKTADDDTWELRLPLMCDGFGDMLDYVDYFKEWQENAEEGECRTFQEFKRTHLVQ